MRGVIVQRRPAEIENDRRIRHQVDRWAEVEARTLVPMEWIRGMVVAMKDIRTIVAD